MQTSASKQQWHVKPVVLYIFIMHNFTSVFLLCKLFLLLFLRFPFLVLGYLCHLQPVGHLPVGTKCKAWTQNAHTRTHTLESCNSVMSSCGLVLVLMAVECLTKARTELTTVKWRKWNGRCKDDISYPDFSSGGTGRGLVKPSLPTSQKVSSIPFPWKRTQTHWGTVLSPADCVVQTSILIVLYPDFCSAS